MVWTLATKLDVCLWDFAAMLCENNEVTVFQTVFVGFAKVRFYDWRYGNAANQG